MRRVPVLALALTLPAVALIGGSATASGSTPSLSTSSAAAQSMDMSQMDMSGLDMSQMDMSGIHGGRSHAAPRQRTGAANHRKGKLPVIHGTLGPDYNIGVSPRRTTAGRYKFVVQDPNGAHNWHIFGPGGVDEATDLEGVGRWVWRIDLVAGTYTIQCDKHAPVMNTTLKVT